MSPRCAARRGEAEEEGQAGKVGHSGGEIRTDNPQEGTRLAHGHPGRDMPEIGEVLLEEGAGARG